MVVLGLNLGYTVKYNPLPFGVSSGFALWDSFRQRVIFDRISLVSSYYRYSIKFTRSHCNAQCSKTALTLGAVFCAELIDAGGCAGAVVSQGYLWIPTGLCLIEHLSL